MLWSEVQSRVLNVTVTEASLVLLALIIVYSAGYFVYNVYFHPLAHIPGPLLYRGTELMKVIQQMKGTINWTLRDLHEQYGPVVRLAPNEVTFVSAKAWQDIYGHRQGRPLPTNEVYGVREKEFFGALSLLWVGDADQHQRHRRVLAPAFSDKSLRDQEPLIRRYVDLLVRRMHERAGQPVDLWAWLNYTTFDLIGDLTFGEPFGCLENSRFHPWISFVFSRLKMMMYGQIMITLGFVGSVIVFLVPRWVKQEALDHIAFTKAKVDQRRRRATARPDFMSQILSHTAPVSEASKLAGTGISEPELYADANILIMAGSETSATLMASTLYHLLATPHALRRLTREIRASFARAADIDFASASRSAYLLAVINEGLRMQPPLPAGINRVTRPEGAVIDGWFVAGGTNVQVPHWACYHNSRNFVDCDTFAPERWLTGAEADPRYAGDNKAVFQPFSVGNRNCIGRTLAITETRLILTMLLWHFDMELLPESENWAHQRVFMLYEKRPLMVRMRPAQKTSA